MWVKVILVQFRPLGQSSWWRHGMDTFSALLSLCVRDLSVTIDTLDKGPIRRSFDIPFVGFSNTLLTKVELSVIRNAWRPCDVIVVMNVSSS